MEEEGKENVELGDPMVVDGESQKEGEKGKRKNLKRKRAFVDANGGVLDKTSLLGRCRQELDELFRYFRDALVPRLEVEDGANWSSESLIACLVEGSSLPLQKLAEEIYEKLKVREGITVERLLRDVPFVGSRIQYGVGDGDLNLGDDESESCLWCWEAREMTLLPKSQRGALKHLRMARKKVRARIAALSGTVAALSVLDSQEKSDLLKATEKLGQELDITEIHYFVERSMQKETANIVEKEAKVKAKEVLKEVERNKRNAEKEKKRKEQELQKEKARSEKELKRLKEEADKEGRRLEKEEVELKKQLKRQQDEADREQKRREKEEAEHKKKLSMQKQATLMERFLKIKKNSNSEEKEIKIPIKDVMIQSSEKNEDIVSTVTSSMDLALTKQDRLTTEELHKSHLAAWHKLRHFKRSQHWGVRQKPKTEVIKELKLHGSSSVPGTFEKVSISDKGNTCNKQMIGNDSSLDKMMDEIEVLTDDLSGSADANISSTAIQLFSRTRKLLQFDKSHRPAYCGSWSKKSHVIGPRHPLVKDPDLDYDVDSDEEWEEEEPGESLTDCDKDDDEEVEDPKVDIDDESEDSFFVPDGYLSENEGVLTDVIDDEVESSPSCVSETENEEFRALLQLQKHLYSLTEKALRKSHPLIISNLMHEKTGLLVADNLSGTSKIEQTCLRALCMQSYPGGCVVDILIDDPVEDGEILHTQCNAGASPGIVAGALSDPDLLEFVKSIQSHRQGISKVIESLQHKFPTFSKTSMRNKVREIADFVDNHHWQVKTEVLKKLGLPISPGRFRKQKIASFFSKRCLPPTGEINVSDSSPVSHQKAEAMSADNSQGHG